MNCFYHVSEPAVAQCKKCGRFLCAYCATASSASICKECVEVEKKRERKSLIRCWILAVILFVLFWTFFYEAFGGNSEYAEVGNRSSTIVLTSICTILIAGMPFGWRRLNRKKQVTSDVVVVFGDALLVEFVLKLVGSFIIGWIYMIIGFFELFSSDSEKTARKGKNKKVEWIDPFTGRPLK